MLRDVVAQEFYLGGSESAFIFSDDETILAELLEDYLEMLVFLLGVGEHQDVVYVAYAEG